MKKTKQRKPEHKGSGIYVHQQIFNSLVKGDTFFDADFGNVIWNGVEWQNANNQQVNSNFKVNK
jgi:hypothetical protein